MSALAGDLISGVIVTLVAIQHYAFIVIAGSNSIKTIFLENFEEIMEYKPSKQFVTDKLKKTENPRIISP